MAGRRRRCRGFRESKGCRSIDLQSRRGHRFSAQRGWIELVGGSDMGRRTRKILHPPARGCRKHLPGCGGLDSMIVGEPQSAARCAGLQVAQGWEHSTRCCAVFEQTLRVAKKIRTNGDRPHAVSIPYAAVELAKKIFGDLRGLQVLLLGAGDMGELLRSTSTNRSPAGLRREPVAAAATELATRFDAKP